jgi:hypothetical protein
MVSVKFEGRLGNNLIQYCSALFFAIKNNLKVVQQPNSFYGLFKTQNTDYGRVGDKVIEINDSNFINFLDDETVSENNHYYFNGYFQTKKFLEKYELEIKKLLNINYTKVNDEHVFVHYRIGDIQNDRRMLPVEYYENALDSLKFSGGYISSDSIDHKFCSYLIHKYNLTPINMTPIETLFFGKNFNNLVLSEGTFSWWIAFLSKTENIICNNRECFWHGDIFFDRWKKLSWDYKQESIYENYKLKEYKPIKL